MESKYGKHDPLARAIKTVLWEDWDPIGVNDVAPDDEYDSYVPGVLALLIAGTSKTALTRHLTDLCVETIGMNVRDSGLHERVATKLFALLPGRT